MHDTTTRYFLYYKVLGELPRLTHFDCYDGDNEARTRATHFLKSCKDNEFIIEICSLFKEGWNGGGYTHIEFNY